jgi:hypothetical protein
LIRRCADRVARRLVRHLAIRAVVDHSHHARLFRPRDIRRFYLPGCEEACGDRFEVAHAEISCAARCF